MAAEIDKMRPYKASQARTYIRDEDLQIHLPQAKEVSDQDSGVHKSIYAHYTMESGHFSINNHISQEISTAMCEAEASYKLMRKIQSQLLTAYKELMHMQK